MIARLWHGAVPVSKMETYHERMRIVALPDYRGTPGNLGAYVLRKVEGDVAHFEMLTFWRDVASIKAFAGEDYEVAKYYDFDDDFLLEKEPRVRHYDAVDC